MWELTEQTNKPTQTLSVASVGINSMAFERPNHHFVSAAEVAAMQRKAAAKGAGEGGDDGAYGAAGDAEAGSQGQSANLLLAVGDGGGNLHIVELPHHLWGQSPHEYQTTRDFIEHEAKRLSYVDARVRCCCGAERRAPSFSRPARSLTLRSSSFSAPPSLSLSLSAATSSAGMPPRCARNQSSRARPRTAASLWSLPRSRATRSSTTGTSSAS